MNKATYNLHDDRFKFWPAERLNEVDYAEAKACKFVWFPGQKCFSAIWRPEAEDFLIRMGAQIEDVCEVDDVAARVERYGKYANNAEDAASYATERLENGKANTERRQRLAENVAAREFGAAAHWQRRIAGAISHAARNERPDVILRRIETLETDLRRYEREQKTEEIKGYPNQLFVGSLGRGQGRWMDKDTVPAHLEWAKRWTAHIEHRLEYERARLAATGHTLAQIASNEIVLEKGGALKLNRRRVKVEGWYYITRLNPSSIEVYAPHEESWRGHWVKIPRDEISDYATPAQVEADELVGFMGKPPESKPSNQPKGTAKARDGKTPEKFGALGRSGVFCDKIETANWYLITKVNKTTVEYLSKQQCQRADKTLYWNYYVKKTDIRYISFLKSPAEVKAQHPDLLEDWANVERIKAKREEKQAAQVAV